MIRRQRRLPADVAVSIVIQLAGALEAAHGVRLIHRDVKPSNVLISSTHGDDADVHAWLGDFGLSKRLGDSTVSPTERPLGQRCTTWRPSRFAVSASTRAPTSIRSDACCINA